MLKRACLMCVPLFVLASMTQAAVVKIDVGASTAAAGWNALASPVDLSTPRVVTNLKDTGGNSTGIDISSAGFHAGANTNGTTNPTGAAAIFSGISVNSSYGNTAVWQSTINPTATVTLSGLSSGNTYDLVFFGSRTGITAPVDNRETEYAVVGGSSETVYLNASNNTSQIASVLAMTPDASNKIVINMKPGPNNTNSYGFFYLSAMQVTVTAVPEPASMGVLGLAGLALIRRRR